jgi:DNA modification methylase
MTDQQPDTAKPRRKPKPNGKDAAASGVLRPWPADSVQRWKLSRIREYPKNARFHSEQVVAQIAESMERFGVTTPVLVDDDGVLIYGHARYRAAQMLGYSELPVCVANGWSEDEKKAYRLADNALAENSTWDLPLLKAEIGELSVAGFDLSLLGFPELKLVEFMADPSSEPELEPELPPLPKNPVTKRGDIWVLGPHKILCGDCRVPADVDVLLGGVTINVAVTSPPYAEQRDYDETSGFRPIPPDEYVDWFQLVAENVATHLAPDGSWFVNIKPSANGLDTDLYVFDLVLAHVRKWGWHFATEFCWERNGVPKSVTRRFKNQFEPVYQFARGDWKMRPRAVMHPSENVPIPFGAGAGQTSWKSAQGGNGPMFGRAAGRFNARPPGRRSGHPNDEKLQGKTDWNQNRRGRAHAEGPTTASKLQGIPGAYGRDVKKRGGFPTAEGSQGTNWQSNGNPLGIPIEEIGEGMAYPGNRLPSYIATHEATGHAAAFPVGLPAFFIKAYSDASDVIYDPFLGSGSTLIAAHQNDRIGLGMELSAAYVDVAVERWQRLTGGKATRIGAKGKGGSSRRRPEGKPVADHEMR